jgi:tRNA(Ile)-lysidine synthase
MSNPEKNIDYWVACSGGLDSIVLVHLMLQTHFKIGLIHCDFQLRGYESKEDARFVEQLAQKHDLPFLSQTFDTKAYAESHRLTIQEAARKLRYQWFAELYQQSGVKIALAHHFDDQVETFIIQLLRGGSVRGLAGMPREKSGIIRPLLHIKRKELEHIANRLSLNWREDSTNKKVIYHRNAIRLELLPQLLQQRIDLDEIVQLTRLYQQLLHFLEQADVPFELTPPCVYPQELWQNLPQLFKKQLLRKANIPAQYWTNFEDLIKAPKGARLETNRYIFMKEEHGVAVINRADIPTEYHVKIDTLSNWSDEEIQNPKHLFVDQQTVTLPITARAWKAGDRFSPLGMTGSKLVSDFLKDRKVPNHQRLSVIVISDKKGIIGVFGFTPAESSKITAQTKQVYKISVKVI